MSRHIYWQSLFWGAGVGPRRWMRSLLFLLVRVKHWILTGLGRRPRSLIWPMPTSDPWSLGLQSPSDPESNAQGSDPSPSRMALDEALLLVAASEDLDFIVAGRAHPQLADLDIRTIEPFVAGPIYRFSPADDGRRSADPRPEAVGKNLLWLAPDPTVASLPASGSGTAPAARPLELPPFEQRGSYWLTPGGSEGRQIRVPLADPFRGLDHLPELPGPPTVLFLLPFLAVGGAERLLFDLLAGLGEYRCLVVTLEPHQQHLGQTVDRCARWTPWIFTLGDWLPREAHFSALSHLIRRFRVDSLMSWNGTIFFYDHACRLRRRFPELRIIQQLYHFEGGWTSRTSPAVRRAVDLHVAVNRPIAHTLTGPLRVAGDHVAVIHHGVAIPQPLDFDSQERLELRRQLGVPADAVVAGTFIRLHPQKRPLDLLALARRLADRGLWLILMGDGPLSATVADELKRRPNPQLVRVSMQQDPLPYYQALDLCLMTSDYEGLPVFLLDGMARGLPAVSPAVGDVPLLFSQGGGLCSAQPGDLDALQRDLETFLDPQARRQAGRRARQTVSERFDLQTYTRAYLDAIFPDTARAMP